ncbi:MAG TPA: hypothetical protein VGV93_07550 [Acidimicrobiales bacterium]|nr:hypothetical protein [Acidimicrobiales bacterium]
MPKQKRTFDVLIEAKLRVQASAAESARRKAERSLRRGRDIDLDVVAAGYVSAKPQEAATTPVRRVAKAAPSPTTAAKAGNTAKKPNTRRAAPPVVKKTASKGVPAAKTKTAPSRKAAPTTQQKAGARKRPAHKKVRRP